jgi:spermidine synthase
MSKLDILKGIRVLEELDSPINGKVKVVQSLGWGISIQAGNLTQSGGVLRNVWGSTLKRVKKDVDKVSSCLILGLGGGSAARLVKNYWPNVSITGVELDPLMVDLGVKYLGLSEIGVDIKIEDATDYCKTAVKSGKKFDFILNDIYVGSTIPEQFEEEEFVTKIKSLMASEDSTSIFNRLYFGEKRGDAMRFLKKLERQFSTVKPIYPEANVMFVCRN